MTGFDFSTVVVAGRIPGTEYRYSIGSEEEKTAARLISFLTRRGFTEIERVDEPLPDEIATAEGALWFYPVETD